MLTLRQHILQAQRIAWKLFEAQDWWRAFRAYMRAERLTRLLPRHLNPVFRAGDELPASLDDTPPEPPRPPPSRAEEIHQGLSECLPGINASLRAVGNPIVATFRSALEVYADTFGPALMAEILAIEDRLHPPPSG